MARQLVWIHAIAVTAALAIGLMAGYLLGSGDRQLTIAIPEGISAGPPVVIPDQITVNHVIDFEGRLDLFVPAPPLRETVIPEYGLRCYSSAFDTDCEIDPALLERSLP